jgi:hypothetical protein
MPAAFDKHDSRPVDGGTRATEEDEQFAALQSED